MQSLVFWDLHVGNKPLVYDVLSSIRARALQYAAPVMVYPTAKDALMKTFEMLCTTLLTSTATTHTTQRKKSNAHAIAQICSLGREVIVQTSGLCDVVVANLVRMLGSGEDVVSMEAKAVID